MKYKVIILLLVSLMVVADYVGGLLFIRQAQTRHYSRTSGVIIKSWIEPYTGSKAQNGGIRVRYEYEVNGKTYRSGQLRYLMVAPDIDISSYPVGAKVNVFYDSQTPSLSVLQVGLDISDYSCPFVLVLLSILAITSCVHFFALSKKAPDYNISTR